MDSKTVPKIILLLGLIIILATSAAFIFVGSYILHLSGNINDLYRSSHVLVPTVIILALGVFLVFLVLIGFIGCILEKKALLGIFIACLFLVFLCEISALAIGLIYKSKIKAAVENKLEDLIKFYSKEVSLKNEIDYIQSALKCCGVMNYTEWEKILNGSIPNSCCPSGTCQLNPSGIVFESVTSSPGYNQPYEIGCAVKVEKIIRKKFIYIIIVLAVIILLQFISLLSSYGIMRTKKPMEYEPFNNGFHV